jgi:hypothetical protein
MPQIILEGLLQLTAFVAKEKHFTYDIRFLKIESFITWFYDTVIEIQTHTVNSTYDFA